MVEAFGSMWVETNDEPGSTMRLVRVNPDLSTTSVDLSTTSIELPLRLDGCDSCPDGPTAGAGALWVPLGNLGVAVINPGTNQVTVIPVDDIGHELLAVAFDGDVAYVSSLSCVTSIIDGEVLATVSPGEVWYLGHVDGVFGMLLAEGRFQVLRATGPMVVDVRRVSSTGRPSGIDGQAWEETGRNYNLRRVEFRSDSEANGG